MTFKTENEVKRHKRKHTNERNYICSHCKKGFSSQAVLRCHVASQHKPLNIQKTCKKPWCSESFPTMGEYLTHVSLCSWSCPETGCQTRGVMRDRERQRHMEKHGELDWSCPEPGCQTRGVLKYRERQEHMERHRELETIGYSLVNCPHCALELPQDQEMMEIHLDMCPNLTS